MDAKHRGRVRVLSADADPSSGADFVRTTLAAVEHATFEVPAAKEKQVHGGREDQIPQPEPTAPMLLFRALRYELAYQDALACSASTRPTIASRTANFACSTAEIA